MEPAARSVGAALVRLVASVAVWGLLLFLLAGDLSWLAGWAYLAINVGILLAYSTIVLRLHPELIAERTKPPSDAKKWDKGLATIVGAVGPLLLVTVCGLDRRFGWSAHLPAALTAIGFVLLAGGGALTNFAVAHNAFFSALVRIQRDRGHHVVDTGPYQVLRHPGYVGSILHMSGTSLALGSLWSLFVTLSVTAVIGARTAWEDRALHEELEGYAEYARHVRYRLIPWVW